MYVGGNGGFTPRHAVLFAEGLDDDGLLRAIDRFLMFYIRTADRLQRTAPWMEDYEGGLDALQGVVFDDTLGIAEDLDGRWLAHRQLRGRVGRDPRRPEKLKRFESFVNAPEVADTLAYVAERGQARPATAEERTSGAVFIGGTTLAVRS